MQVGEGAGLAWPHPTPPRMRQRQPWGTQQAGSGGGATHPHSQGASTTAARPPARPWLLQWARGAGSSRP
jgi:hypothetical protein